MHPIWCTPPVRFVDLKPEKDVVALKKGVEGRDADVVDVAVLAADVAETVMDGETGVQSGEVKEIVGEVSGGSGVAFGDDLEDAAGVDLVDVEQEVAVEVVAADDEMAYLVTDVAADLIVAVAAAADFEAVVADSVTFDLDVEAVTGE